MSSSSSLLTEAQLQTLKRALLRKGAEINAKLTDILAGKQVSIDALLQGGEPGERPEERLRRFLDRIDVCLRALRSGGYGRCERCAAALPFTQLEQVPWADTCPACASG